MTKPRISLSGKIKAVLTAPLSHHKDSNSWQIHGVSICLRGTSLVVASVPSPAN
jgi:hypothetical protein